MREPLRTWSLVFVISPLLYAAVSSTTVAPEASLADASPVVNQPLWSPDQGQMVVPKAKHFELQSQKLSYTLTISGALECPQNACSETQITITAQTAHRQELSQRTKPTADGRFKVSFKLNAAPSDQLDWQIQVESLRRNTSEGGRMILQDETDIQIRRDIDLL